MRLNAFYALYMLSEIKMCRLLRMIRWQTYKEASRSNDKVYRQREVEGYKITIIYCQENMGKS